MRYTGKVTAGIGAALVIAATLPGRTAGPVTPWGDPDLQGVWTSEPELGVPFERPTTFGNRLELTEDEFLQRENQAALQRAADTSDFEVESADTSRAGAVGSATSPPPHWLERGAPSRRTSLVIAPSNGRIPPTTAEAKTRPRPRGVSTNQNAVGPFNSWLDMGLYDRCITRGVPNAIFPAIYNANTRLVQSPGYVAITYEMIHETRLIPVGGAPAPGATHRQMAGQARGRWDGDTLVVETSNFSAENTFRGSSQALRLIERFTRVDHDTLRYEVTVDDPTTWTGPWTAALNLKPQSSDMFEYACHEGNFAMRNILSAARAAERGGR